MSLPETIKSRASRPAPKWFRIANSVWGQCENLILGWAYLSGYAHDAAPLLKFKLLSSGIREIMNTMLTQQD